MIARLFIGVALAVVMFFGIMTLVRALRAARHPEAAAREAAALPPARAVALPDKPLTFIGADGEMGLFLAGVSRGEGGPRFTMLVTRPLIQPGEAALMVRRWRVDCKDMGLRLRGGADYDAAGGVIRNRVRPERENAANEAELAPARAVARVVCKTAVPPSIPQVTGAQAALAATPSLVAAARAMAPN